MGANGAAMGVLPNGFGNTPDRDYYLARLTRPFHDDRWRRLPVVDLITQFPLDLGANRLLESFGGGFPEIDRLLSLSASE